MIRGALIDLAGVVYLGSQVVPGAIDAIGTLRAAGLPVRFITNTTRMSKAAVLERLSSLGLDVDPADLFTPAAAAWAWLAANKRSPHLLVHSALVGDFEGLDAYPDKAVVIGDAGHGFTYDSLNSAFRALMSGAAFLALAENRYYREGDGALSLDAGGFVKALEFASGKTAITLGKPAPDFYATAVASLGCSKAETVMVGDDAEADASGALGAGIGAALLVRTGKYQPGAEDGCHPRPTDVVDDIVAAAGWILDRNSIDR